MAINKPEVVAWMWEDIGRRITQRYDIALELSEPPFPVEVEPLIRLSDYEALQAEYEHLVEVIENPYRNRGRR